MLRNKKILMFILAGSLFNTYTSGKDNALKNKYDNLYDRMTKNINNKSSDSNNSYKMIEKILNQRNKELRDLYIQNDYVVKPEYLEWQIFFNAFYNNKNKGGIKSGTLSAFGSGEVKKIDLGMVIPLKGIKREKVTPDLSVIESPILNLNINVKNPQMIYIPELDEVIINIPEVPVFKRSNINPAGHQDNSSIPNSSSAINYSVSGNTMFENLNLTNSGETKLIFDINNGTIDVNGNITYENSSYTGVTAPSYIHRNYMSGSAFAVNNIGNAGKFNINGDWSIKLNNIKSNESYSFINYYPAYSAVDGSVTYNGNLKLETSANALTKMYLAGLSLKLQYSGDTNSKAVLENKGLITIAGNLNGTLVKGMQVLGSSYTSIRSGELINSGTIIINANSSNYGGGVGILAEVSPSDKEVLIKTGDIEVLGTGNSALFTKKAVNGDAVVLSNTHVDGSNGKIFVKGYRNQGITLTSALTSTGNSYLENMKNMNIVLDGLSGVAINKTGDTDAPFKLNGDIISSIEFGENSKDSAILYLSGDTAILEESLAGKINADAGEMNRLVLVTTGGVLENYMPVVIGSGAKGMRALEGNGGIIKNYADIINNSSEYMENTGWGAKPTGGTGILALGSSESLNKGNITMNGDYATAIYTTSDTFVSDSKEIIVNGKNGIGFLSQGRTGFVNGVYQPYNTYADIKADKLEVNGESGAVLFSDGGVVDIGVHTPGNSMKLIANGDNTLAFYTKTFTSRYGKLLGKYNINGDVDVEVKNGGIAFNYDGQDIQNTVELLSYFSEIIDLSNGKLTVNVDDRSYNMILSKTTVNLSELSNLGNTGINFTGSGKIKLYNTILMVDIDSNIDKNNTIGDKTYLNIDKGYTRVNINKDIKVSGTEDGQVGLQAATTLTSTELATYNRGIINLTGNNTFGIAGKGTYKGIYMMNEGGVALTGESAVGMAISHGIAMNNGTILIGANGIGMYGETEYPTEYSAIINKGKIIAAGEKSIGIYVISKEAKAFSDTISLEAGSDIDVSGSKYGIGVYLNKAELLSAGSSKITVGENGIAIYIKDQSANVTDLELNLFGNNSVGVFTDGTASFNGTGNVNIDGKGIVVFNIEGSGNFNQDFNISSTSGSQYTVYNLKDTTVYSNSNVTLGEGGTYITGSNTAILLEGMLSSSYSNIIGVAANGQYVGGLPVNINGETLTADITNRGIMNFQDKSAGIYVINGASAENYGTIDLGKESIGMYGAGTGTKVSNMNKIAVKDKSIGMYLKDGEKIYNNGSIEGAGERIIGLYLEGDNNSNLNNLGDIKLLGDKSVGIYITGEGTKNIYNSGKIEVGDSQTEQDPGIGIYNNSGGSLITNENDITTGQKSMGIYNNGGKITHTTGNINVGNKGTGIYSASGEVNLKSGSMNLSGQETVGIYGTNNSKIDNNLNISVSDQSYGIVLNTGSELINRNSSTVGNNGILLYSDEAGSVRNESGADVTLTGSDSIGFYMVNGGSLENKASITGNTGVGNIGIYNKEGSVHNSGAIEIGDSVIIDLESPYLNNYAVGLYGEKVQNMVNTGNVRIGKNAVGFYVRNNVNEALNKGDIISDSERAIGIFTDMGAVRNEGNLTLSGNGSIGIAAERNSLVTNSGIIRMNGDNSIGIYANSNSKVINESTGKIYINGNNSTGIQLSGSSILENNGLIEVANGTIGSKELTIGDAAYTPPSIINAGIIKVDEKFDLDGLNIIIKPDPGSFRIPTLEEVTANGYSPEDINGGFLLSNGVNITAPSFNFGTNAAKIDPLFTQGTNARVYKFENVFDPSTPEGGQNTGELSVKSTSLTFDAIPVTNASGKVDIWMEKIDYDKFTQGAWYDEFAKGIEGKYLNAQGEALKLYDKLDLITEEKDLRGIFEQLSGSPLCEYKAEGAGYIWNIG